jgi:hypothetical protein
MSTSSLPISPAGRRYGRFRDNLNHPDRKLLALVMPIGLVLPPNANVWAFKGLTRDQKQESSCTGQLGAEIRDAIYRQFFVYEKDRSVGPTDFQASAEYVYLENLIAEGELGRDDGATIHQTFITLTEKGVCPAELMPYSDNQYSLAPNAAQEIAAAVYKVGAYHYLPTLDVMKSVIASGYSFGAGIDVYSSFENSWREPGMMPMPNVAAEQLLGGHAQHFMAYDDDLVFPDGNKGGLGVQNSWGSGWGISAPGHEDGGCYWMPYAYVKANLLTDAWVAHLGPIWK